MSAAPCSGNHKTRLFIGEGNFTYTEAFIQKHDEKAVHSKATSIAHSIISTELVGPNACGVCDLITDFKKHKISSAESKDADSISEKPSSCETCSIISRIESLKNKGVEIFLGVDATSLSHHKEFAGKTFPRIHWNCPHDGSPFQNQSLPPIILKFFQECSKLQNPNDRIHITLAQPENKKDFYQGYVYDISRAARTAGYTLIKKRKFEKDRYPSYQHTQTKSHEKASVTDQGMREFIFKKIDEKVFQAISKAAQAPKGENILIKNRLEGLAVLSNKSCRITSANFYKKTRFYYLCSSDEESSDCGMVQKSPKMGNKRRKGS